MVNPLATEVADGARSAGLDVRLEVERTHPKDWANPGRARVDMKGRSGVKNSECFCNWLLCGEDRGLDVLLADTSRLIEHHLYILVAQYLKSHPTTEQTPLRLPSMPGEERKTKPPPAKPRGWKMNDILPMHSPAVKGHGVSENLFKDMQEGMGVEGMGGGSGGAGAVTEGGGKKKKDKKGKKGG